MEGFVPRRWDLDADDTGTAASDPDAVRLDDLAAAANLRDPRVRRTAGDAAPRRPVIAYVTPTRNSECALSSRSLSAITWEKASRPSTFNAAVESALRVTRSHRQSLLLLPGLAPVASSGFENSKKGGMDLAQKGDGHDGDREDYGIGVYGSASYGTHSMRRTKAAQIYRKAAASARGNSCSAIRT